ncbi:MarR family transcriptional regulator [Burkholderia contaminans]|uniref:MarR family transcriptional regulator n=2 Tax=Burkholderiaceae TaxID=119060 RepID=UPI0010F80395|nr:MULTISPECIES: helix-turn-helix domain-containing protein [Burkholderia]MBD1412891.1 MarR family transcriptional regulator [Burkholderia contaminans]UXZ68659.1 MarR family transcriptional regulator [Burkholderia contaminans]UXZ76420.1 MarR family transcriptional regulator [Burkholderia contaminans]
MIANTSIDSYCAHKAEGKASIQRITVLNYLRERPGVGMTRNDLARVLRLPIQSICGRIGELKDEGLVVEGETIEDPRTHRSCKTIRIAPDLLTENQ